MEQRTFRLGSRYELVPFDRLSVREQAVIAELRRDPDFFGALRPVGNAHGTLKAVSRSTALLLYALQVPGTIPRQAVAGDNDSVDDIVRRLTLDGVIETERDGLFVSGAAALEGDHAPMLLASTTIARISREAIRLVAGMTGADIAEMASRMYAYNRRPVTPRWSAHLHTPGAVLRFAGAESGSAVAGLLERHWKRKAALDNEYWISWWPRSAGRHRRRSAEASVTYKLYVSPRTDALPDAFPNVVKVLAEAGAPPFKLGGSPSAILRPDKLVAYFASRRAAEETAAMLGTSLFGIDPHPVPFTCELVAGGLVSLGIDPPAGREMLAQTGSSWRVWVTRRLASYIATACQTGHAATADAFALQRISLDGVDPASWEPSGHAVRGYLAQQSS